MGNNRERLRALRRWVGMDVARPLVHQARRWFSIDAVRMPVLKRGDRPGAERAVYFLCPDELEAPSGGVFKIYEHAELLSRAGVKAAVVHNRPGFRYRSVESEAAVVAAADVRVGPADLIVVPEIYVGPDAPLPTTPFVIFNQGVYNTFDNVTVDAPALTGYRNSEALRGVIVLTEDSREYIRFGFPDLKVFRIRPSIDARLFHPSPELPERRIAMMPRLKSDAVQVIGLLTARGRMKGWSVDSISGVSRREVAERLRRSAIYLHLSYAEGLGLPPLEAAASGCLVTGYHAGGLREYVGQPFLSSVERGDILALVSEVERMMALVDDEARWRRLREDASRFIAERCAPAVEADDVRRTYEELLSR